MPITARMAVVLPAPLRPTSPTISPGPTWTVRPSTATSSPKRWKRPETLSPGWPAGASATGSPTAMAGPSTSPLSASAGGLRTRQATGTLLPVIGDGPWSGDQCVNPELAPADASGHGAACQGPSPKGPSRAHRQARAGRRANPSPRTPHSPVRDVSDREDQQLGPRYRSRFRRPRTDQNRPPPPRGRWRRAALQPPP